MHCPQCGQEYRQGDTVCTNCGASLTQDAEAASAEPEAEWVDLETVLETSDAAQFAVARSLLEAEGIPCFAPGELLQETLGWGRMPSGTNLLVGPVKLQVPRDRAEEARRLLVPLPSSEAADDGASDD